MSHDALGLAKENAARLGLLNRFHCLKNNLLEGMEAACFDVVVSNPPYIQSRVCRELDSSVRDYEPLSALDGGADGLDLIRRLVRQAADLLRPGGGLFLEIGYDQGSAVSDGLKTAGFSRVNITEDYAGNDRIVSGWKG
jgi:release factor glutamine methyltransferase